MDDDSPPDERRPDDLSEGELSERDPAPASVTPAPTDTVDTDMATTDTATTDTADTARPADAGMVDVDMDARDGAPTVTEDATPVPEPMPAEDRVGDDRTDDGVVDPDGADEADAVGADVPETDDSDRDAVGADVPAPEVTDHEAVLDRDLTTEDADLATDTDVDAVGADTSDVYAATDSPNGIVVATSTPDESDVDSSTGAAPGDVPMEPVAALWPGDSADRLRSRWKDVQLRFVDEPRAAADDADQLLEEVVTTLTQGLQRQRAELGQWRSTSGSESGETEHLRVAVQRYREFLDAILTL